MRYELEVNQTRSPQGNRVRRGNTKPSGVIVIHTAENVTDIAGSDPGAENVLNWILTRPDPGSYHVLCDSDSTRYLLPWKSEAFHDRNTNRHSVGISAAISAASWPQLYTIAHPGARSRGHAIIDRMAAAAADFISWIKSERGITVPVKKISRADAHAGKPGIIGHGESDPGRRTDPGSSFDWDFFFDRVNHYLNPQPKDAFMSLTDAQQKTLLDKTIKTNAAAGRSEAREGEMLELLTQIRDLLTVREKSVLLDKTYKTNAAVGRLENAAKEQE